MIPIPGQCPNIDLVDFWLEKCDHVVPLLGIHFNKYEKLTTWKRSQRTHLKINLSINRCIIVWGHINLLYGYILGTSWIPFVVTSSSITSYLFKDLIGKSILYFMKLSLHDMSWLFVGGGKSLWSFVKIIMNDNHRPVNDLYRLYIIDIKVFSCLLQQITILTGINADYVIGSSNKWYD